MFEHWTPQASGAILKGYRIFRKGKPHWRKCVNVLAFLLLWRDTMITPTLVKENIEWELAYIIIIVGSMAACRKTWYWKSSWESYIQIRRDQEERGTVGLAWASETQSLPSVTYVLQQGHTCSKEGTAPNSGLLWACWGHFHSIHNSTVGQALAVL